MKVLIHQFLYAILYFLQMLILDLYDYESDTYIPRNYTVTLQACQMPQQKVYRYNKTHLNVVFN